MFKVLKGFGYGSFKGRRSLGRFGEGVVCVGVSS